MKKNKRIAYFLAKWHIHQQVADGALMFAEKGYLVDIFLYQSSDKMYNFEIHPNIRVIDYTIKEVSEIIPSVFESVHMFSDEYNSVLFGKKIIMFGTGSFVKRFLNNYSVEIECFLDNNSKIWGEKIFGKTIFSPSILKNININENIVLIASSYYKDISQQLKEYGLEENIHFIKAVDLLDYDIFHNIVLTRSLSEIKKYEYDAFIGVEKVGLIWAGMIVENLNIPIPYFYHSLELYTSDHFHFNKHELLHQYEKKYHKRVTATIIQDEFRKKVLLNDNEVSLGSKVIYVPVSVVPKLKSKRSKHYFQEKFQVPEKKVIILLWSNITKERFCEEIVMEAQNFPENFQVIIHGPSYGHTFLNHLKELDIKKRVVFSTELVAYQDIEKVIDSADIGLAFYKEIPINDQLTVLSSEKIARYLEAGKPIVSFSYENYRKVMDENLFGEYIDNLAELKEALIKIVQDYEEYSKGAQRTFYKFYDFSDQYQKVIDFVEN